MVEQEMARAAAARRAGRRGTVVAPPPGGPEKEHIPSEHLCTVEEAAEHLSVSVRFVRRLVAERRIRHVKVGRFLRFERGDLDAFLASGVREPVVR